MLWTACTLAPPSLAESGITIDHTSDRVVDLSTAWTFSTANPEDRQPPTPDTKYQRFDPHGNQIAGNETAFWLKTVLTNATDESISHLLEIDNPLLGEVDLFVIRNDQIVDHQRSGLIVPASAKTLNQPQPVFPVTLPAHSDSLLYLNVHTRDKLMFSTKLWAPASFYDKQLKQSLLSALGFGAILVMCLYNLLIFLITGDRTYLGLSSLLGSLLALLVTAQGWGSSYLWHETPQFSAYAIGPFVALTMITLLIFCRQLLHIPSASTLGKAVRMTNIFNVGMFIVLAGNPSGGLTTFLFLVNAPMLILLMIHAARQWKRQADARHFLLAMAPLTGTLFVALFNRGLELGYSSSTVQGLVLATSALLAVSLGMVLALRIRRINEQRDRAHHIQRLAEDQARQSESRAVTATRENAAKSAFLATMSHEIRTPMNGILGMADLLQHTDIDQQQTYYLATLTRSGHALMDILNDVLDYSKVEAGKLSLEQLDTNLLELLDDILLLYREPLRRKGLDCYMYIHPEVPQWIKTDPTRLKQVLNNLLNNAVKFTDAGEISIRVKQSAPGTLSFAITDDGVGMDAQTQASLFNRFQQADSSISRKYGGTGLGLAISKHLIELFGGAIEVESKPGEGSTFLFDIEFKPCAEPACYPKLGMLCLLSPNDQLAESLALTAARWQAPFIHLKHWDEASRAQLNNLTSHDVVLADGPVADTTDAIVVSLDGEHLSVPFSMGELAFAIDREIEVSTSSAAPVEKPLLDMELLVAEDNPTNRLVVGKILSNWGANVRFAENGLEAQAMYESEHRDFDLVLMDCEMPEMDGYSATRAIRRFELEGEFAATPIIALTAHVLPEFRAKAMEVGMSDYITKPVNRDALLGAILKLTPGRQTAP